MNHSIIFSILSIPLFGYIFWLIKQSTKPAAWPSTIGYIVCCHLETITYKNKTSYHVEVTYGYIVGDREYKNHTLAFGYRRSSNEFQHEEILTRLRNAESIRVSYDPDDPQSSVLSYGIHRSIKTFIAETISGLILFRLFVAYFFYQFTIAVPSFFVVGVIILRWLLYSGSDRVLLKNLVTY